jgi:hypothetical protein
MGLILAPLERVQVLLHMRVLVFLNLEKSERPGENIALVLRNALWKTDVKGIVRNFIIAHWIRLLGQVTASTSP